MPFNSKSAANQSKHCLYCTLISEYLKCTVDMMSIRGGIRFTVLMLNMQGVFFFVDMKYTCWWRMDMQEI